MEVESLGARLDDPMVFHQSNFLIDIVNRAKEQGDYVFFIDAPTEADDSIGVPVFRHSAALTPAPRSRSATATPSPACRRSSARSR